MRAFRIDANLDCEATWAGAPLPAAVRAKLAGLATLVRAVVPDGATALVDLPPGFDRGRIADPDGAPPWRPRTAADDAHPRLAWGADDVAAPAGPAAASAAWRDRLAAIAPPAIATVRPLADRRWSLALGQRLGAALSGAQPATSVAEVEAAIAGSALRAASGQHAWIAKAAISAAGRDRVRRRGPLDDATRTRLMRLAARGGLVVEPWVERLVDVGQPGLIDDEVTLLPAHRLLTDPGGGFVGIAIAADPARLGLTADEHAELRAVAAAVGAALAAGGYRGAFTVDAFAWRDPAGVRRFHALCEVNPRLTFGLVARAWSERVGGDLTLHLGSAIPAGATALLHPAPGDPTSAWLAGTPTAPG
ncbi:MAG: hypothetical protein K8W52_16300 [Deltaproteobacteria bacterium]|nr:hypothetical protein [Deltaproteobacteria bacterium]